MSAAKQTKFTPPTPGEITQFVERIMKVPEFRLKKTICERSGVSSAALNQYETGIRPISAKAWRKLRELESDPATTGKPFTSDSRLEHISVQVSRIEFLLTEFLRRLEAVESRQAQSQTKPPKPRG